MKLFLHASSAPCMARPASAWPRTCPPPTRSRNPDELDVCRSEMFECAHQWRGQEYLKHGNAANLCECVTSDTINGGRRWSWRPRQRGEGHLSSSLSNAVATASHAERAACVYGHVMADKSKQSAGTATASLERRACASGPSCGASTPRFALAVSSAINAARCDTMSCRSGERECVSVLVTRHKV